MLTGLIALPSLSCLRLELEAFDHAVELSILSVCPSLTHLALDPTRGRDLKLTSAQLAQCLSLGRLHSFCFESLDSDTLTRLLHSPVTVQWRDIGHVWADERSGELLQRLPSLTTLDLAYHDDTAPIVFSSASVAFLSRLPLLRALRLGCDKDEDWCVPADALLDSLLLCNGLTELHLECRFDDPQSISSDSTPGIADDVDLCVASPVQRGGQPTATGPVL